MRLITFTEAVTAALDAAKTNRTERAYVAVRRSARGWTHYGTASKADATRYLNFNRDYTEPGSTNIVELDVATGKECAR